MDILNRISSHPELCAELCQKIERCIVSRLNLGMSSYQRDKSGEVKEMSDRAYAWMVAKLEMTEFESRDRLALLAFLDLVMSNPLRASQDMRDAGKVTRPCCRTRLL